MRLELSFIVIVSVLAVFALPAQAQLPGLHVEPPDGCPSQRAVEAELGRLLPIAPPSACCLDILVEDNGDSFSLQLNGERRRFPDEARDCRERARMVAVALAMTLAPPVASDCTVADPRPEASPAPPWSVVSTAPRPRTPSRRRLLLTVDTGATYLSLEGFNFGAFALSVGIGAEFERWSLMVRGTMEVGGGPLVVDASLGPALGIKLSPRIRLGFAAGLGFGIAQLPYAATPDPGWVATNPTMIGAMVVAANAELTVDLYTHGQHTIYALVGPEFKEWVRQDAVLAQVPSHGHEVGVRLALGYRFLR